MTVGFMALWSADGSRTKGMTLAERNRRIVPAHALRSSSAVFASDPMRVNQKTTNSRFINCGNLATRVFEKNPVHFRVTGNRSPHRVVSVP
jgi:hypothetical protein